ncbi:unnamed protein product [Protopolystoma xenopodis]|uniref:Uncharacterized protein n=1 Tax=Protopolystoma xenopodis TaxID=117903 RepID=A0A3S5AC86_9PLAT|nr:unnamed protein product [Protopolystoma xenopodis]
MASLTDVADFDAGESSENVPSPLSDVGNHDNDYGKRLRTRCIIHSPPDNKTKLQVKKLFFEPSILFFHLPLEEDVLFLVFSQYEANLFVTLQLIALPSLALFAPCADCPSSVSNILVLTVLAVYDVNPGAFIFVDFFM